MADYSTTIGVFQSQVGKSGDILLKFEQKNGGSAVAEAMARQGERDSTAEQRDDEREHRRPLVEKRRATHKKITLSAPCRKPQRKNEKLNSKFTCDLEFYYFYSDFCPPLGKEQKKMAEREGFEPSTIRLMKLHLKEVFIQSFERNFLNF